MNKTKKFVVTLLSVLMVLSFMPAMAFAVEDTSIHGTVVEHDDEPDTIYWSKNAFTVPADEDGLKVLLAPTCDTFGVGELSCEIDKNCGAKRTVYIWPLGHKPGRTVRKTAEEIMDYLGYDADDKAAWYEYNTGVYYDSEEETYVQNGFCEGYVQICDQCGEWLDEYGYTFNSMYDAFKTTYHTAPTSGVKKCADSFTCTVCNKAERTNKKYNAHAAEVFHATEANLNTIEGKQHQKEWTISLKCEPLEGHGDQNVTFAVKSYVDVTKKTCKECGEQIGATVTDVVGYDGVYPEIVSSEPEGYEDFSKVKGGKDGKEKLEAAIPTLTHSATTRVVITEPNCDANGTYEDVCKDCGITVSTGEDTNRPAHKFVTVVPFEPVDGQKHVDGTALPEMDKDLIYQAEVCETCNTLNNVKVGSVKVAGFDPDDPEATVSYTKIADANCEQGAWVMYTYKRGTLEFSWPWNDVAIEKMIKDGDIVEINGKYYGKSSKKEIPYEPAKEHKYGALTKFAEATCTEGALEGKICEKCGAVDHETVVEVEKPLGHDVTTIVVEPTCGAKGYTYDTCSRCKQIVLPEDAKDVDEVRIDGEWAAVYNVKAPIVSAGTPCKYEWFVTEPATATKEGKKVLKCTVCGHEKEGSETVVPIDPTEADKAADEAIVAATDVLEKKAQYTPASIDAIKDAIKDLNTARILGDAAAIGRATEQLNKVVAAAVPKKANTMTVKAKTIKASASKNKTFKKAKAFTVKKAKGKVTFKKVSGNKKITVTSAGKVAVKKGLKKGKTYKVKVMVTAAGNDNYLKKAKTVTLKVKVK